MCLPALAVADALVARGHAARRDPLRRRDARGRDAACCPRPATTTRCSTSSVCSAVAVVAQPGVPTEAARLDVAGDAVCSASSPRRWSSTSAVTPASRRRPRQCCAAFPSSSSATTVVPDSSRSWWPSAPRRALSRSKARRCRTHEFTGAPVGQDVLAIDRDRRPGQCPSPARPARTIASSFAVVGGSLGSQDAQRGRRRQIVERLADRRDLAVHHVVGERILDDGRARSRRAARHHVPSDRLRGPHAAGLCRSRPDGDAGRRGDDRRAGHRRHARDHRAVARSRRKPPGRQRPRAQRPPRRSADRSSADLTADRLAPASRN